MSSKTIPRVALQLFRRVQTGSSSSIPNVKGLSSKVVDVPTEDVGPGASKSSNYKNPEYFCYNNTSYFEAEVEMLKFRLPQPSIRNECNNIIEEEFRRACSDVCEIVPQSQKIKPAIISIYTEKPAPTISLQEVADSLEISKNVIYNCGACPVGPGASKRGIYKNPEYYCYHKMSYYEAMKNLTCYRMPQPSNKKNSPSTDGKLCRPICEKN